MIYPLFTLPVGLVSLLAIQMGQRNYPFKTQANWVFVLYPVRGNKLKQTYWKVLMGSGIKQF